MAIPFLVSASLYNYKYITKPILFRFDAEIVHQIATRTGELFGKSSFVKDAISKIFAFESDYLKQNICGIDFKNPLGLAAGFDYEARLTQILASFGFGFQSVGTITNMAYEGNPKPRLGRLPESNSLMVYKGFKNDGADYVARKLQGLQFPIPLGISIGKTNSKQISTQNEAIKDIAQAFEKFENAKIANKYYELNISCPNLFGNVDFYSPKKLRNLLSAIESLKIKKPIFVKMPIDKSNYETLLLLEAISSSSIQGVIFGNLLRDRNHKGLIKNEVEKFPKGNFSGKPCFHRSNQLIQLARKNYKKRFVIVGCGGIFSPEDAFIKIALGANLTQLITGMIYKGPGLISQINMELEKIIKNHGLKNISEAVGIFTD
ncbi:MAG: quinone-dependent dihydroorotate dehydrogenase [Patescibacteria group bacterium]|nr:quinone-dependent dihydroorotate dehydrogenase [Patescibacteria group bacterium]